MIVGNEGSMARYACAAIMVLVSLAMLACGGDDGVDTSRDRADIRRSLDKFQAHLAAGNIAAVCRQMTPTAKAQVGVSGHGLMESCRKDVRQFMHAIGRSGRPVAPELTGIVLDGDRASAIVRYDPDRTGAFVFKRTPNGWKLASVFSATATSPVDLGSPIPGVPSIGIATALGPAPKLLPVSASEPQAPCPAVEASSARASGGCRIEFAPATARLRLRTLFGNAHFANCVLRFVGRVGPSGKLTIDSVMVSDGRVGGDACGDIQPCVPRVTDSHMGQPRLPWRGTIGGSQDGDIVAQVALCFDTCAGRLQGHTEMRLTRVIGGWAMRAIDAPVGRSGLSLDGTWRGTTAPLMHLRVARAS
jgi:hypothetical protein